MRRCGCGRRGVGRVHESMLTYADVCGRMRTYAGVGGEGLDGFKREASAGVGGSDLDEDGFALGLSSQDEQVHCLNK